LFLRRCVARGIQFKQSVSLQRARSPVRKTLLPCWNG
jgi:hypothetical protein